MTNPALDRFGEFLVAGVRDRSIDHWMRVTEGRLKGEQAVEFHRLISTFTPADRDAFVRLVPSIVDTVLHQLLTGLEQNEDIEVSADLPTGRVDNLREVSDGLAGELYGKRGWVTRFSKKS